MNTKNKGHKTTTSQKQFDFGIFSNIYFWSVILVTVSAVYIGPFCFFCRNKITNNAIIVQDWERIDRTQTSDKFFVYSAFYDRLGGDGVIKILGATSPNSEAKLYCHLFNQRLDHYETVGATIQVTRHASRELPMSPVTIFCKLSGLMKLPSFVSLSPQRALLDNYSDFKIVPIIINNVDDLDIGDIPKSLNRNQSIEFAACVQPTYNYDDVFTLLQWIEFQILMGVQHFTFYNISIGPSASCLIRHYNSKSKDELISVLPWQNIRKIPEIHNNGQVVQAQDCAARYKNLAKFVVILDFDEYILPQRNLSQHINNYQELIQYSVKNVLNNSTGMFPVQFQFRSGLFGLGFPAFNQKNPNLSELEAKIAKNLSLLKHITRLKHIKPFHYRSKFITMPEFVTEPGIHSMVHATPRNGIELLIPETVAYVHHYRKCPWASDCGGGKEIVEDKTGHFWAQRLLPKVMTRYQEVGDLCGIQL